MAISVSGAVRPKLNQTVTLPLSLVSKAIVEDDTGDAFRHRVCLASLIPDPFTLTGATWTTADGVVNLAVGISNLRVGDGITGTGIPANTYVLSIASPTQFTLSATPTVAGSNSTLNVTPPTFDATLMIVQTKFVAAASQLTVSHEVYLFDGTKAFDADRDGDDECVIADALNFAKPLDRLPTSIDLDSYLTNARKAKTNT